MNRLVRLFHLQDIKFMGFETILGNWGCKGGSQASAYMYIYGNDGIESDATYVYKEDVEHEGEK